MGKILISTFFFPTEEDFKKGLIILLKEDIRFSKDNNLLKKIVNKKLKHEREHITGIKKVKSEFKGYGIKVLSSKEKIIGFKEEIINGEGKIILEKEIQIEYEPFVLYTKPLRIEDEISIWLAPEYPSPSDYEKAKKLGEMS